MYMETFDYNICAPLDVRCFVLLIDYNLLVILVIFTLIVFFIINVTKGE